MNYTRHQQALTEYCLLTRLLQAGSLSDINAAARQGLPFSEWGWDSEQGVPFELGSIDAFMKVSGWRKYLEREAATQPARYLLPTALTSGSRWLPAPFVHAKAGAIGTYYHIFCGDRRSPVSSSFYKNV